MCIDELSEEDKLTVNRARKIQRFPHSPFMWLAIHLFRDVMFLLRETVRGFREILEGVHDEIPRAIFNVGTIDEVVEKYKRAQGG